MNKASESFSAFLDGEANELDVQRMLKALDDKPELIQDWHALSKVKASLQEETLVDTALDFTDTGIRLQDAPERSSGLRWLQGAVAAAVAVVAITTVNLTWNEDTTPAIAEATIETEANSTQLAQQQFEAQLRLDEFLKEHAEQASFTSGHVVVPAQLHWVEAK